MPDLDPSPSTSPSTITSPTMPLPNLFIVSLGNPGSKYFLTRHSVGHAVLSHMTQYLHDLPETQCSSDVINSVSSTTIIPPSFLFPSGVVPKWTFFANPTFMNVSGPSVLSAFSQYLYTNGLDRTNAKLVVVHDSLDDTPGNVRVVLNGKERSAKGHNGIKSLLASVQSGDKRRKKNGTDEEEGLDFVKVGIGIGRPGGKEGSRDPKDVEGWVLGTLKREEQERLKTEAFSKRLIQGLVGIL